MEVFQYMLGWLLCKSKKFGINQGIKGKLSGQLVGIVSSGNNKKV